MENKDCLGSTYRDYPSLLRYITSKAISGFDTSLSPRSLAMFIDKSEESRINDTSKMSSPNSPVEAVESRMPHNISISLPASPCGLNKEHSQRVRFSDCAAENVTNNQSPASSLHKPKVAEYHSQPILAGRLYANSSAGELSDHLLNMPQRNLRSQRLKDKRFDSFKTLSGKLERQISSLRGKPQQPEAVRRSQITEPEAVPAVHRYFDALEGPELETLKSSEELVLPHDKKWPFLLRFPVSSFGICLGVSSQAILWKTLATSPSTSFLHVSATVNLILWCISLVLMGIVTIIYALKLIFYFEAVRREYYHPIRVNFFFAPWIACLFLALGVPPKVTNKMHAPLWYVLMAPILCLELKIYGQWMSGGQRRLSKVANPSNHLSVVGNFVGALLGASMGLKEGPIFFFAVGLAHYIVLFITLYQRLPTNETLPKELHPVFFLFVAAPSVACMAWAKIMGDFDNVSRMAYFLALFLYGSLAVRINFFRGFRFSLAWWAYTFPMTGASIATIKYSTEVKNLFTQCLSVALSAISSLTVSALLVSTIVHAFVLRDLFPNDISIAITERKKSSTKHSHTKSASCNEKDLEACNSL